MELSKQGHVAKKNTHSAKYPSRPSASPTTGHMAADPTRHCPTLSQYCHRGRCRASNPTQAYFSSSGRKEYRLCVLPQYSINSIDPADRNSPSRCRRRPIPPAQARPRHLLGPEPAQARAKGTGAQHVPLHAGNPPRLNKRVPSSRTCNSTLPSKTKARRPSPVASPGNLKSQRLLRRSLARALPARVPCHRLRRCGPGLVA